MYTDMLAAFHCGFGGQVGHCLERGKVLRPAVGVAAVIDGVDAYKDVVTIEHFRPGESEGQKDGVAGWDIGHRDTGAQILASLVMRHSDIVCKRGTAENPQIEGDDNMRRGPERASHSAGSRYFDAVALPVIDA